MIFYIISFKKLGNIRRLYLKMASKKKILNRIKAVLAEKAVPNKELAQKLKVAPETVSRWCTNDIQPSIETLFEIAKVLDVDIRELLVKTK